MSTPRFDLGHLLRPLSVQSFFDECWERRPLHLRRPDAHYYDGVLTIEDLERFIASPEARYPAIQLSKRGAYFPPEVYSEDIKFGSNTFTGVSNVQKIAAEYRAGATIVLPALQRTCLPLGTLCANIESELNHVVHANAYVTPGNTAGFTPHYDTHEVVVLQIAGQKHWRIYEPPIQLPHRKQPFTPAGYTLPSKPILEVDLSAGDLLYLPRGYIHTTTTSHARSAHVTIGIAVYTWLDLAGELLQAAMASPKFRKALPPGFASRAHLLPPLNMELNDVLDDLRDSADSNALVDMFLNRVRSTKSAQNLPFRSEVSVIGLDSQLRSPAPEEYRIVEEDAPDGKIVLEFKQSRFLLPREAASTIKAMQKRQAFTALDIAGSLDIDTRLALVRVLHENGFLSVNIKTSQSPA